MPTIIRINDPGTSPEKTQAVLELESLVAQHDATLENLNHSIMQGYQQLWGRPGRLREKAEVIDILNADPAKIAKVFQGHAAFVATLEAAGLVTFDPWEKVPPYAVSFTESGVELGEELNPAWVLPEPEPEI